MKYTSIEEARDRARVVADFHRRNRVRVEALREGNAKRYAALCDELGFSSEDKMLYERGLAELGDKSIRPAKNESRETLTESSGENFKSKVVDRYNSFLVEANRLISGDSRERYNERMRVLMKHFPKFGPDGKQDINGYSPESLYGLFMNMVRSAREKVDGQ